MNKYIQVCNSQRSVKTTNNYLKVGSGIALINEYIMWFTNEQIS